MAYVLSCALITYKTKKKIFLVTMIIFQTYVILHLDIVLCCTIIKEEGLVKIHI